MKNEPLCSLKEYALQKASENGRNKAIQEAYDMLVSRVSNKIQPDFNKAWDKFPRFEKGETTAINFLHEFYTPYCSVKLIVRNMNYIISFTTTEESFNSGFGIRSTELLRLAFEATRYASETLMIQNALEIRVDNNISTIYKQKVDARTDRENLRYFNQRTGSKG